MGTPPTGGKEDVSPCGASAFLSDQKGTKESPGERCRGKHSAAPRCFQAPFPQPPILRGCATGECGLALPAREEMKRLSSNCRPLPLRSEPRSTAFYKFRKRLTRCSQRLRCLRYASAACLLTAPRDCGPARRDSNQGNLAAVPLCWHMQG